MKKNEPTRTLIFVFSGLLLATVAGAARFATTPVSSSDFELVGKEFYEDFHTAADARSLEVFAVDPDTATMKEFRIRQKDGSWVIPSHYDYPAEATYRIAETATSVIGIKRESLVGRLESEHEKYGVVDPLSDGFSDLDSIGKRLTMKNAAGDVLVDYIVGNEADDVEVESDFNRIDEIAESEKYFYVRRADEKQTYKVKFDIDLSTKFSDWIEPDLLQLDTSSVADIKIDNYQLKEQDVPAGMVGALSKIQGDQLHLLREQSGPWTLEDLFEEQEELKQQTVNEILNVLRDLKIVGVRPKYSYKGEQLISADLKINQIPELTQAPQLFQREMDRLQVDLDSKGFNFVRNPDLTVASNGGMMTVGTGLGVVYTFNFGKSVVGDEDEIEIGSSAKPKPEDSADSISKDDTESATPANAEPADEIVAGDQDGDNASDPAENAEREVSVDPSGDDSGDASGDKDSSELAEPETKNRYLMIRVSFDESLLGEKPIAPVKAVEPVMPEGYTEPDLDESGQSATDDVDNAPSVDLETQDNDNDLPPSPDAMETEQAEERNQEFVDYEIAMAQFQDAEIDYMMDLTRFEDEITAYNQLEEAGRKAVDNLNERFGKWYYVIAADNLSALQVARADLIEPIELEETPLGDPPGMFIDPTTPQRPNIEFDLPEDFDSGESGDGEDGSTNAAESEDEQPGAVESDAGESDAGESDAGESDAGESSGGGV